MLGKLVKSVKANVEANKASVKSLAISLSVAGLTAVSMSAEAATLTQIANNIIPGIRGFTAVAGAVGYLVAFFFLLGAIFKFKQYGEDSERHSLKAPVFLLISAVLAAYMSVVLSSGSETLFGTNVQSQGADGNRGLNL